jgi:hypothetical protein
MIRRILTGCGIVALWALLFLVGCADATPKKPDASPVAPVATPDPPPAAPAANVHIVNSAWKVVREEYIASRVSASINSDAGLQAEVTAYNSTHTDDQWRLIYGDVPPIEAAPTADAFIVYADTHDVEQEYRDISRADLSDRRASWRLQVDLDSVTSGRACILYVDNVPPAPTPPAPVNPYVQYAIYVVDVATGEIVNEEHPAAGDYAARLRAWMYNCELRAITNPEDPWQIVTGRLWP